MSRTLTKTDIEFESVTILKVTDPRTGDVTLVANIGYTITTSERETIKRDLNGLELTGTDKTRMTNALTAIKNAIKTREGI